MQNEKRRAIVSREIDAVIEFAARDRHSRGQTAEAATRDQKFVHTRNCRGESLAIARNHERDLCVRKFFANRRDGRRRQNQIADSFELNEENLQFDNWIARS